MDLTLLNFTYAPAPIEWTNMDGYKPFDAGYPRPAKSLDYGMRWRGVIIAGRGKTVISMADYETEAEADEAARVKCEELQGE